MSARVTITTPVEIVAEALYNSCVPDHAEYPFTKRCVAERRAFEKQADVAIKTYEKIRSREWVRI